MISFAGLPFIFRFLPIFLLIYFLTPVKYRRAVLLLGSYVFYAMGDLIFLPVLILLTVLNYLLGVQIWNQATGFEMHEWQSIKQKKFLVAAIILDVSVLVLFKGLSTFVDNSLLPLGISFYIFKMISFQADVLRREISIKPKLFTCALYFSLFPQVVQGPIMRYAEGDLEQTPDCSPEQFEDGLKYYILGLGMKVLLADRLAILWNDLQMIGFQSISTPLAWLGAIGYSLRLYFDFWGYSLMASGILVMLGYPYIENFNHPYAAKSISEFYRRWHVTLGSWFRDYVYFPMGGSRCSKKKMVDNLAIVWILTGFWHGNGWNYLIWGGILGLLIILEKLCIGKFLQKIPVVGNLYVILLIPLTWVVFAITDLKALGIYLGRLFPFIGGPGVAVNQADIIKYAGNYSIFFIAGILLCIPFFFDFYEKHKKNPIITVALVGIFWVCIYYASCSAGNPFMYLNF